MAVLPVVFLDSGGCSRVFHVFFHIVYFAMRYHTRGGHGLAHMIGKRDAIVRAVVIVVVFGVVIAVDFPGTSVSCGEEVLVTARGLGQATGDGPDFCLRLILGPILILCERTPGITE